MILSDVQKAKLTEAFVKEGLSRGVQVNPFDVSDFLTKVFSKSGRVEGFPLATAFIQEARTTFNLGAYNNLVADAGFDIDVLFNFYRQARLEVANNLFSNDLELKRLEQILDISSVEVDNFFKNAENREEGLFRTKIYEVSLPQAKFIPTQGSEPLAVDPLNGTVTLPEIIEEAYRLDTKFLASLDDAVSSSTKANLIVRKRQPASLENLINDDANPWLYELECDSSVNTSTIVLTIPFPTIEKLNVVKLKFIPGASYEVKLYGKSGESWITLEDTATTSSLISRFDLLDLTALRIELTASRFATLTNGTRLFLFGLTSFEAGSVKYLSSAASVIKMIDPGIGGRPIVEVSAQIEEELPESTSSAITIGYSTDDSFTAPSEIIRKDGKSKVTFSLVKYLEATASPMTSPIPSTTQNGLEFSYNRVSDLGVMDTTANTFLPSHSEVWIKQNILRKQKYIDYTSVKLENALLEFSAGALKSKIYPRVVENFLAPHEDAQGLYIPLNYKPYNTLFYNSFTSSSDDITSIENGDVYGVFKLEVYQSASRDNPTVINHRIQKVTSDGKIYISGTYATRDVFSVSYRGILDSTAIIRKGTVSIKSAIGSTPIDPNLGLYQVNYDDNTVISAGAPLLGKFRCDLNALMNASRLYEFTGKVHFSDFFSSIVFTKEMTTDLDAGEYIILVNEDSGQTIRLDNVVELKNVAKGWYNLYIMSKPLSRLPSAIKSFLEARDNTGGNGASDLVFNLESTKTYVDKIGLYSEPASYENMTKLTKTSTRANLNKISSIRHQGELLLTVPSYPEDDLFYLSNNELTFVKMPFFSKSLFRTENNFRVHSYLDIKMSLSSASAASLSTPEVKKLTLTVKHI